MTIILSQKRCHPSFLIYETAIERGIGVVGNGDKRIWGDRGGGRRGIVFLRERERERVFWLNIAKFEVNLCYKYCSNLFMNLRKESEFQQYHCRNSTKVGERKRKRGREKFFIFGNTMTEIPSAHMCCPSRCSKCECAQGKPNVAMALSK